MKLFPATRIFPTPLNIFSYSMQTKNRSCRFICVHLFSDVSESIIPESLYVTEASFTDVKLFGYARASYDNRLQNNCLKCHEQLIS